jgi:hypothetical protein
MSINVGRQVNLIAFHRDGSIGPETPERRFPPPWSVSHPPQHATTMFFQLFRRRCLFARAAPVRRTVRSAGMSDKTTLE